MHLEPSWHCHRPASHAEMGVKYQKNACQTRLQSKRDDLHISANINKLSIIYMYNIECRQDTETDTCTK